MVALVLTVPITVLAANGETEEPDFAPSGEIYDTLDLVADDRLQPTEPVAQALFIVEAPDGGDVLTRDALLEWKTNADALRADPPPLDDDDEPHLATQFDFDLGVEIDGVYSVADAVDEQLRADGLSDGLADPATTDADVKLALATLFAEDAPTTQLRFTLSQLVTSRSGSVGDAQLVIWEAPAFTSTVVYDVESFDPDDSLEDSEHGVEIEEWLREVQTTLRGDQVSMKAIGVVIDPDLVAEESLAASSPFILLAVVFIVLLVGAFMRSYWASAFVAVGLCSDVAVVRGLHHAARIPGRDAVGIHRADLGHQLRGRLLLSCHGSDA